jgi:Leucine-rich repeat (LRR) protein
VLGAPRRLPESLKRLKVVHPDGPLPAGLESLDLSQNPSDEVPAPDVLGDLPKLPDGLKELNLRNTKVRELPGYLQELNHLDISFTLIDSLEDLPSTLKSLSLGVRQVKSLEGLPKSVTALHFHGN